jgi:hypothetical protein
VVGDAGKDDVGYGSDGIAGDCWGLDLGWGEGTEGFDDCWEEGREAYVIISVTVGWTDS